MPDRPASVRIFDLRASIRIGVTVLLCAIVVAVLLYAHGRYIDDRLDEFTTDVDGKVTEVRTIAAGNRSNGDVTRRYICEQRQAEFLAFGFDEFAPTPGCKALLAGGTTPDLPAPQIPKENP